MTIAGCTAETDTTAPAQPESQKRLERHAHEAVESLDHLVSSLKEDLKAKAGQVGDGLAKDIAKEVEKAFDEMKSLADDFEKQAEGLGERAKARFESARVELDKTRDELAKKFEEFKNSSGETREKLLSGLYDAVLEMKAALDKAAQALADKAPNEASTPV
jgi:predicted hydrocarbon binding protein